MKKVAISQSNYIPWIGYFHLISEVDEFIILDSAQFTRRDWRNRNKIYTSTGPRWLTIPVETKGKYNQLIYETKISDEHWCKNHWLKIYENYRKAEYFGLMSKYFEKFYLENKEIYLSNVNHELMKIVCELLEIETKISLCKHYSYVDDCATSKLMSICNSAGADIYLSGPAAKNYFDFEKSDKFGIEVEWMDYSRYPSYRQLYQPFEIGVSVIDLIFNVGPNAKKFLKNLRNKE